MKTNNVVSLRNISATPTHIVTWRWWWLGIHICFK